MTSREPGRRIRVTEVDGRLAVVKRGAGAPDEAAGLAAIASVHGAPPVPEVLRVEEGLLVTAFVEQSARSPAHEERLGRSLALLHLAPVPPAVAPAGHYGGGSRFIGACSLDPAPVAGGAEFYRRRLTDLARRAGGSLERAVSLACERLEDLLEGARPSLVHGDLWWGNVLWGADGAAWLIDPSAHSGHADEDVAMLGLFGAVPGRLLAAYRELLPAAPGEAERRTVFELYPLLVHTVLFGGGYRRRAEEVARSVASAGAR